MSSISKALALPLLLATGSHARSNDITALLQTHVGQSGSQLAAAGASWKCFPAVKMTGNSLNAAGAVQEASDSSNFGFATLDSCKSRCDSTASCVGVNWDPDQKSGFCLMSDSMAQEHETHGAYGNPSSSSCIKGSSASVGDWPCFDGKQTGWTESGFGMDDFGNRQIWDHCGNFGWTSMESCVKRCKSVAGCSAAHFDPALSVDRGAVRPYCKDTGFCLMTGAGADFKLSTWDQQPACHKWYDKCVGDISRATPDQMKVCHRFPVSSYAEMSAAPINNYVELSHATNIDGAKFDVNVEGTHNLLWIPKNAVGDNVLLKVDAEMKDLTRTEFGPCQGLFVQKLTVTGKWMNNFSKVELLTGGDEFNTSNTFRVRVDGSSTDQTPEDAFKDIYWAGVQTDSLAKAGHQNRRVRTKYMEMYFGSQHEFDITPGTFDRGISPGKANYQHSGAGFAVSWNYFNFQRQFGHQKPGDTTLAGNYLNIEVTNLAKFDVPVSDIGGLLGHDSHDAVTAKPAECSAAARMLTSTSLSVEEAIVKQAASVMSASLI